MRNFTKFYCIFAIVFTLNLSLLPPNKLQAANALPKFYLGNENAPVTVYEFISLSCLYCIDNINLFMPSGGKDNNISNLIKNGKIKLVIMDFPIHGKVDFIAHSILYYSKSNEQYFNLLKLFLNNQEKWFNTTNPTEVIINYGKLAGLKDESIEAFKNDNNTTKIIIQNANNYISKYNIRATPTTIIEKSNKPISEKSFKEVGIISINKLENAINNLLKNEQK